VANLHQQVGFENNFQPLLTNLLFRFSGEKVGEKHQYSAAGKINVNIL
jgi:hypothetical protein